MNDGRTEVLSKQYSVDLKNNIEVKIKVTRYQVMALKRSLEKRGSRMDNILRAAIEGEINKFHYRGLIFLVEPIASTKIVDLTGEA